ncbi:MAG: CRTAC1 family protein [Phycisphaerales bacterium]
MVATYLGVIGLGMLGGGSAGCSEEEPPDAPPDVQAETPPAASAIPEPVVPPPAPPNAPWFELAADIGLDFEHHSGERGEHWLPSSICGGGGLVDIDGDGDLDAYLVQSGPLPGDLEGMSASVERPRNRLFLNDGAPSTGGAPRFIDISHASGTDDDGYGMGLTAADYDADGDFDLYVTNLGANVLYRNDGPGPDGTTVFTDVTERTGTGDPGFSTGAAFFDADGDGDLDLWVLNYIDWTPSMGNRICYNAFGSPDYCVPTAYDAPSVDRFYRNRGDGTFVDDTEAAGLSAVRGTGLGIVAADFDGDRDLDVFVANDAMADRLWVNRGDGRFIEDGLLSGVATDAEGRTTASMGVTVNDWDFDGDLDLLICNVSRETDSLFRNEGGMFVDVTNRAGLGTVSRRFTRFGHALRDFDHDGFVDLLQANGRVMRQNPVHVEDDPYAEPNVLMRGGADGRFREVEPRGGTAAPLLATSRGLAFGDIDDDGDVDALVINRDGPAHLLLNIAPKAGRSIVATLVDETDRPVHHATLRAQVGGRSVRADVRIAESYLVANDDRVHVGLGAAPMATDVTVEWADGSKEFFDQVPAGRWIIRRGSGAAVPLP